MAGRNNGRNRHPRPLCVGTRQDGSPCNNYRELGGELCRWHLHQNPELTVNAPEPEPAVNADEEPPVVEPDSRSVAPAAFRGQLAEDLAAGYGTVHQALKEAMEAKAERYGTCPHCHVRVQVFVADHTARMKAIQLWSEMGFGKPASESASVTPRTHEDFDLKPLEEWTDAELDALMLADYERDPLLVERDRDTYDAIKTALRSGASVEQAVVAAWAVRDAGAS